MLGFEAFHRRYDRSRSVGLLVLGPASSSRGGSFISHTQITGGLSSSTSRQPSSVGTDHHYHHPYRHHHGTTKLKVTFPPGGGRNEDHITSKWEGLPLTSESAIIETEDGATIITDTIKDDEGKKPKTFKERVDKVVKILLPHVILIGMLLCYLCIGAFLLIRLETATEMDLRRGKLHQLANLYAQIQTESYRWIQEHPGATREQWQEQLQDYLDRVSTVHVGHDIRQDIDAIDKITSKWTFPTALLYALTVLTTCGYGEVDVRTSVGQIFAVSFALIGIPLMFITAADIGKFLSETLLRLVIKSDHAWKRLKSCALWYCCRRRRRKSRSTKGSGNQSMDGGGGEDAVEELASPGTISTDQFEGKLWFPIFAYVSMICLYCSMGAVMFRQWEAHWAFVHAFHFGFNLIVTVGLGDIVVNDPLFLCLIVAYVIIGLSVVTMCVDLASTHLKAYFTKIHYFGRARKFFGMSEDLREIVGLLAAMRKKKGGKVTWNDVKDFLDHEFGSRAYEPHELLTKLRYIDETSSGMSTIRHNSCTSADMAAHTPPPPPPPMDKEHEEQLANNNDTRRTSNVKSVPETDDFAYL